MHALRTPVQAIGARASISGTPTTSLHAGAGFTLVQQQQVSLHGTVTRRATAVQFHNSSCSPCSPPAL